MHFALQYTVHSGLHSTNHYTFHSAQCTTQCIIQYNTQPKYTVHIITVLIDWALHQFLCIFECYNIDLYFVLLYFCIFDFFLQCNAHYHKSTILRVSFYVFLIATTSIGVLYSCIFVFLYFCIFVLSAMHIIARALSYVCTSTMYIWLLQHWFVFCIFVIFVFLYFLYFCIFVLTKEHCPACASLCILDCYSINFCILYFCIFVFLYFCIFVLTKEHCPGCAPLCILDCYSIDLWAHRRHIVPQIRTKRAQCKNQPPRWAELLTCYPMSENIKYPQNITKLNTQHNWAANF